MIGQTVAEISRFFCDFQDGSRRHLGFSEIRNFYHRSAVCGRASAASLCQISLKSCKRLHSPASEQGHGGQEKKWTLSSMRLITRSGGSCRAGFMLAKLQVLTNSSTKQRISDEWDKIDQQLIGSAIKQWRNGPNTYIWKTVRHTAMVRGPTIECELEIVCRLLFRVV